jgi:uncharacterized protein (DUF362 family)
MRIPTLARLDCTLKGIDRSIRDINAAVPAHFVIADGIIGMEGNRPMQGGRRRTKTRRFGRDGS